MKKTLTSKFTSTLTSKSIIFSGEHGGYSRNSHHPSVSSVYSTLPHVQIASNGGYPGVHRGVRLSATELDLDTYSPLTTPIVIETTQNTNEGPICASSPKRSMSAFTTFGQNTSRSNVTTPMSPTGPASGHLV